jgi:23S rRNA (guanosine2251-2'-O)-methyltransferase
MSASKDIIIWGIHPVLEILTNTPELVKTVKVRKPGSSRKLQEVLSLAEKKLCRVEIVSQISIPGEENPNHQGVTATLNNNFFVSFTELVKGTPPLLVALDSITDPHNLGAIIRSAAAAGAAGIIIPKDRSVPITGTVIKVATGALAHINICQVTNLSNALQELKESGYWAFGAAGEAQQTIYQADFSGPVCLVIGSEGKGLRPLVRKQCDFLVSIPMNNEVNSLNASVAAGIMLFEIARQKNND